MFDHRLRRWLSIKPVGQRLVFNTWQQIQIEMRSWNEQCVSIGMCNVMPPGKPAILIFLNFNHVRIGITVRKTLNNDCGNICMAIRGGVELGKTFVQNVDIKKQ